MCGFKFLAGKKDCPVVGIVNTIFCQLVNFVVLNEFEVFLGTITFLWCMAGQEYKR